MSVSPIRFERNSHSRDLPVGYRARPGSRPQFRDQQTLLAEGRHFSVNKEKVIMVYLCQQVQNENGNIFNDNNVIKQGNILGTLFWGSVTPGVRLVVNSINLSNLSADLTRHCCKCNVVIRPIRMAIIVLYPYRYTSRSLLSIIRRL